MQLSIETVRNTRLAEGQSAFWYLGQEGILIKNGEHYLAVDPYLTDSVDKKRGYIAPWTRLYPPPVTPEELAPLLDVVLFTHMHDDHADPETVPVLAQENPNTLFVVPAPERDNFLKMGVAPERVIAARADEKRWFSSFRVTPVPAAHTELHTDAEGNFHELGYIIEAAGNRFFHAGDMSMYDGLIERLQQIDVALLPINGRDYFRTREDIIGNLDANEAVLLAKEIGAKLLVPLHHDLYSANGISAAAFVLAVEAHDPFRRYHIFAPGERYIYARD